ncbi:NAD(P)/FAD-dependent oxidoreductase [Malonomonas rubra]|uniref:NAD(P)/FAD-dependent oxidoreductase n=1 Tax=Malonomonas rubra TaxID=57040 RepID=UPI0026E988E1|nr:NAD(P)/FAD-dependent oxidoreductase [Malonomonas rubra]
MTEKKDILEKGAIVQRDRQTYAIVPHTPAGLISSAQLRTIADVADKYRVPTIKLTSAQRLALIGLQEEQIDLAWQDLDQPIGYTTGLCVRSVKICPGIDCCKRGLQDSVAVGLELDERFHGYSLPWKMKLGVSGCPNDCGETCIKDIGLIGTPKGWHLTVGGNGGSQPRLSQRLIEHIPDDQQALAAVERLIAWFVASERKCRLGKLMQEVGLEKLREIAQGG